MKKTPEQKIAMKDNGCIPFFWGIVHENGHFLHVRNWLTGEHRVFRK